MEIVASNVNYDEWAFRWDMGFQMGYGLSDGVWAFRWDMGFQTGMGLQMGHGLSADAWAFRWWVGFQLITTEGRVLTCEDSTLRATFQIFSAICIRRI